MGTDAETWPIACTGREKLQSDHAEFSEVEIWTDPRSAQTIGQCVLPRHQEVLTEARAGFKARLPKACLACEWHLRADP